MEEKQREISLSELMVFSKSLVYYIFSKWFKIFAFTLLFGSLGVLYAWLKIPIYVAELSFVTETDNSSKLGMYAGIASQFGLDIGGTSSGVFEGENLMQLIKSRTLVEKTLLSPFPPFPQKKMVDIYLENDDKDWRSQKGLANVQFEDYPMTRNRVRDSIMNKVYKVITEGKLDIDRRDKKTNIIYITMKDENELFAQQFSESLVTNVIQYYSDYKVKKSRTNVEIIQRQTDSIRRTLFSNITEVASTNDLNVNPIRQIVRTGAQRKQVDVQANGALYAELLKNLELARLSLRKETPLIQIIDEPILPLKKIKPGRLMTGLTFAFIGFFLIFSFFVLKYLSKGSFGKTQLEQ